MKCEFCKTDQDGSYGSGRFCNSICARSFSSSKNRKETNKKISETLKGHKCIKGGTIRVCDYGCGQKSKYQLNSGKQCCEDSHNKCPKIKEKNSKSVSKAYKTNPRKINVSEYHWKSNKESKGYIKWKKRLIDEVFIKDSDHKINKVYLVEVFNRKYECVICKTISWNEKKLILHLDHINGDNKDNRFENIRFLCPNCHSQTDTYGGKNIEKSKLFKQKVSNKILLEALLSSDNIHKALIKCDLLVGGANYHRATKLLKDIDMRA